MVGVSRGTRTSSTVPSPLTLPLFVSPVLLPPRTRPPTSLSTGPSRTPLTSPSPHPPSEPPQPRNPTPCHSLFRVCWSVTRPLSSSTLPVAPRSHLYPTSPSSRGWSLPGSPRTRTSRPGASRSVCRLEDPLKFLIENDPAWVRLDGQVTDPTGSWRVH